MSPSSVPTNNKLAVCSVCLRGNVEPSGLKGVDADDDADDDALFDSSRVFSAFCDVDPEDDAVDSDVVVELLSVDLSAGVAVLGAVVDDDDVLVEVTVRLDCC